MKLDHIFTLFLLVVLIASTQERKVPKFLQKFNKSLGLSKNSEILWDILAIRNNTNQIKSLKERVDQLEECYNCTTKKELLLVATGWNSYNKGSTQSQVVDTNSPNNCSDLQQYPYPIYGSTGGVLNEYPVICGGLIDQNLPNWGDRFTKFCYKHDHSLNEWTLFGNLSTGRYYHASALLNGALWMTGGVAVSHNKLKSTELVNLDGPISYGTPLPESRYGHCMATLHDGRIIIIGGDWPHSHRKSVLIFNPSDESYSTGPALSNELTHGACAIFKSAIHGNRPVVFAGAGREKKAQLFDYTIANTWEEISDLPDNHPTYPSYGGARAMPTLTGDGIILQHKQYFYQLNCDQNTCSWEILEEELSEPAHYGATMILPAKYTCL